MKKLLLLPILILLISCDETCEECLVTEDVSYCQEIAPLDHSNIVNGYIEGDIIPDKGYLTKGFVSGDLNRRWKDGIVPYFFEDRIIENDKVIQPGFTDWQRDIIRTDFANIETSTGIKFIEFDSEAELLMQYSDGVYFRPSFMGSSHLGRQGGIQETFLSIPAPDFGEHYVLEQRRTTYHEVGHTLGLHHEHTRPDRDEHIIIDFDNIHEGVWDQFIIRKGRMCGEFDLKSVMIYPSYAGVIDESKPAMRTIEGEEIPTNYEYSEGDKLTIQAFYE